MWLWSPNWDAIRHDIVIGNCPLTVDDLERLRRATGATALLSLQHDECHVRLGIDYAALRRHGERIGLAMARCPIRDFDVTDMRRHLVPAVGMLDALLRARQRVYVHCTAGVGRSPLVVLGYLTLIEGCAMEDALALIRARRPTVCPSLEAYQACREDLVERFGARIARRAAQLCGPDLLARSTQAWAQAEREVLRDVIRDAPAGANPGATVAIGTT